MVSCKLTKHLLRFHIKGNHKNFNLPRPPHKRGTAATKRGLSKEQVCVPVGVNLNGLSIAKVANLGRPNVADLQKVLGGKIAQDSVFVTDSLRSYQKLSFDMGLNHIRIPRNKYKNGVFNIQIVNNYHKRLKDLIFGTFKGVATKYLNNYIVYHNFAKDAKANKKVVLFDFIRNTFCQSKTAEIAKRPAIPIRYLTNIQLKLFDNKCRNRLMDNEIEVLRRSNHELYKIWVNVNQVAKALSMSEQANLPINHT